MRKQNSKISKVTAKSHISEILRFTKNDLFKTLGVLNEFINTEKSSLKALKKLTETPCNIGKIAKCSERIHYLQNVKKYIAKVHKMHHQLKIF